MRMPNQRTQKRTRLFPMQSHAQLRQIFSAFICFFPCPITKENVWAVGAAIKGRPTLLRNANSGKLCAFVRDLNMCISLRHRFGLAYRSFGLWRRNLGSTKKNKVPPIIKITKMLNIPHGAACA